jgi:hypothetical protein
MLPIDRIYGSEPSTPQRSHRSRFPDFHRFQTEILPRRRHRRGEEQEVATSPVASKSSYTTFPRRRKG